MKKLLAVMSLVSFVGIISLGSASAATEVNGCVKEKGDGSPKKNTTIRRVAVDDSNTCKSKEVAVSLPTTTVTEDLQEQIDLNDEELFLLEGRVSQNESDIADNAAKGQENMEKIDALTTGGISSMIGGGHDSFVDFAGERFMPAFGHDIEPTDDEVHSKVAVTGWLTKLAVDANNVPGNDAALEFRLVIDGTPVDLSPLVNDNFCTMAGSTVGEDDMCTAEGCVQIDMGQTLSVRVLGVNAGSDPDVSPTRWTARFVETESPCPVL